MLDCGLSMQSLLNFLPLSFVASNRLLNLNNFVPPDVSDPDLEGVSIEIFILNLSGLYQHCMMSLLAILK